MIEIEPGRYFSQWWFLCSDTAEFDILGALYRDEGETKWHVQYRFRYYDGTNRGPFEDRDEKRWWRATIWASEEVALKSANKIFGAAARMAGLADA